jgi:hypothetical protein
MNNKNLQTGRPNRVTKKKQKNQTNQRKITKKSEFRTVQSSTGCFHIEHVQNDQYMECQTNPKHWHQLITC